ncbi:hypothetical protein KAW18_05960 [candidate division WOR-3 bacterium]|nr:hypothetical protein [candidate division WOR-3 bacterium]MCK4526896.1 hypothetical protein [candidate division WOR-3 bacterium]
MKKYLLSALMLILINCSVAPVTRYSSSLKKEGIGLGVDASYGRRLETNINSDGSIDSLYDEDIYFPIVGVHLRYTGSNFSINGRLYGFYIWAYGVNLGIDYYFNPQNSSPFIGLDLSYSQSTGESTIFGNTTEYSYKGFSSIGVLGYSLTPGGIISISPMLRGGASIIDVQGNSYVMPELGLGINGFFKVFFLEMSPEVFLNFSLLPSGDWKSCLYPGLYLGIAF